MNIEKELGKLILKAEKKQEVPVAAIITRNNKIIAKAYNKRQKKHDVMGHAEIIAINKATKKLKTWNLEGCDIYISLEPCNMCKSIIEASRIDNVYYYVKSYKHNKSKTIYKVINNNFTLVSKKVMHRFFLNKR